MKLNNKLILLLVPFVRLGNAINKWETSSKRRFSKLKKADNLYNLGSWNNEVVVQTIYGKVRGKHDSHDTLCWKGIPYAKPPIDLLRWKAPLDPEPWEGLLKANKFGGSSTHILPILGTIGSEDCLFLNIWRPNTSEGNLPVYVFIHGGGNSIGTSATPDLYGHTIAGKSQLLYVSVNYRLGIMGWFRHPAVTQKGSSEDQSGNFGTLDLIKSLEWVKKNISAFGGHPDNITISGESAGAMNILSLLISPKAHRLFHKAIIESGLSLMWDVKTAEKQSNNLLSNLLIKDKKCKTKDEAYQIISSMSNNEIESYFRSKSAVELLKTVPSRELGMADWSTIYADGNVIPSDGYKVFSTGKWINQVPMVIGTNKNEMKLFGFLRDDIKPGSEDYELVYKYKSLLWRVSGCDAILTAIFKNNDHPPIFAYRFDWGALDDKGNSVLPDTLGQYLGAHHYAEVPFFLGTQVNQLSIILGNPYTKKNRLGRSELTKIIMEYLANFAKKSDPNDKTLPEWMPWNNNGGDNKIIVFNSSNAKVDISYLTDIIDVNKIREMIESELTDKMKEKILKYLDDYVPFGLQELPLMP